MCNYRKIDGTNAQVYIVPRAEFLDGATPSSKVVCWVDDFAFYAGSRTRWIVPDDDNHGFAKFVQANANELLKLGPGRHFGEWWGAGIQRGYGLTKGEKRFSLFNTSRWTPENVPACCHVVPVLYRGLFTTPDVEACIDMLRIEGSKAAPGFMRPEGVIVYHVAAGTSFKKTLERDEAPKSKV